MQINYTVKQKARLQKLFLRAIKGLYIQNGFSIDHNSGSLRGSNNTKCPIGFLISDKQISNYALNLIAPVAYFPKYLIEELMPEFEKAFAISFLSDLQLMHDSLFQRTPKNFRKEIMIEAKNVAKKYNLKFPTIQEIKQWTKKAH